MFCVRCRYNVSSVAWHGGHPCKLRGCWLHAIGRLVVAVAGRGQFVGGASAAAVGEGAAGPVKNLGFCLNIQLYQCFQECTYARQPCGNALPGKQAPSAPPPLLIGSPLILARRTASFAGAVRQGVPVAAGDLAGGQGRELGCQRVHHPAGRLPSPALPPAMPLLRWILAALRRMLVLLRTEKRVC
jgi:hypothetical protein